MDKLIICYHGTNKRNSKKIQKEGFKPFTYFSRHLEDAIGYGGKYVFEVVFKEKEVPNHWQVMCKKAVSPKMIKSLKVYERSCIYQNNFLGEKVFKSQTQTQKDLVQPDYCF